MTLDDLEMLAMQHKALPEFTPLPETCFYWTMRTLHDSVRDGKLNRDAARAEKARAIRRYNEFKALYTESRELFKERQKCIRLAETMMNDMVKECDALKAAEMAFEVIGIMTGDTVFVKAMREKWKEATP